METSNIKETRFVDPVYCPQCTKVIKFIPRDAKLKYIGSTIECPDCKKRFILNEGRYFLLEI